MNAYKELWIKTREDFIDTIGREPTDKEMDEIMADVLGDQIDEAMMRMKDDREK